MMQTIRIGLLLREAVAAPYRKLVTRPTGVAVRGRIEAAIARLGCRTALLDFSEIELLDFSCADEVIAKLLLSEPPGAPRFVVLGGLQEEQYDAIDHVLTRHGLAVAAVPPDGEEPLLLGGVAPDARLAFACLYDNGALPARRLADVLGWTEERGREALHALAEYRLVHSDGELYHPPLTA
jgi:hypothetical protein